ncbi:Gfo/Idh/MocA family protein [Pontibacter anaerobius]|uniref:Gfo/Idh/MocA family oxidoreductase n=1 Tax=Pontibacter anaerobius TaxID=2993940 RepID=A0ABT3RHF4_9BACT|nr:Gfo/Idh/MocA family oxidoreductase [Pontibacter anaerobius]MCX2740985.1 Gfo/Idh/MocA family oxidoreductase [Pontibacter anaerobius]
MIKCALIGAGKMGISHLSILGAHPDAKVVGVADNTRVVTDVLQKYTTFPCYTDYRKMLEVAKPDAVFVAAPTKYHSQFVNELVSRGIHVFVEKPFCLNLQEGKELVKLVKHKGLINQVGYHNKFIGTFREAKSIIKSKYLGTLQHFVGESYGPVVIRKKQNNWRSSPEEGGGCLLDYASHVIDLINDVISPITRINGCIMKSLYSTSVEDSVYSLLEAEGPVSGVLSVNWSDETFRKMSTSITIIGSNGKIISDASELKVYFKSDNCPPGYSKGWNIRYVTDLTEAVDFYLRGEEYSAQVDYFIRAVKGEVPNIINTFESALLTDSIVGQIKRYSNQYHG